MRASGGLANVTIDVFANASHLADGAAPTRSIVVTGYAVPFTTAIAFDTLHDELWLGGLDAFAGNDSGRVTVFSHASNLSGSVAPTRDIQGLPDFSAFAIDTTHDALYLAGGGGVMHGAYVFNHASALITGAPVSRTIEGVDGTSTYLIAVDEQRDILYVPSPRNGLGIVHSASTASASVATLKVPSDTSCCTTAASDARNDRLYVGSYANAYVLDNASTLSSTSSVPAAAVTQPGASIYSFAFP